MPRDRWEGTRPALTPDNELVYQVWRYCEGWKPQLFADAFAVYGVADADMAVTLLIAMRDRIESHKRAREAAEVSGGRRP